MTVTKSAVRASILATLLMSPLAHAQVAEDAFVPEDVFAGRSEGKGELRLFLAGPSAFTVDSVGTLQADGRLHLGQEVRFEDKPVQSRSWVMWKTGPGRYSATLTGAAGPVVGRVDGSRLTLRYPINGWGLAMHQTLDLSADRSTLMNSGRIRFLGIPVGRLEETIKLKR